MEKVTNMSSLRNSLTSQTNAPQILRKNDANVDDTKTSSTSIPTINVSVKQRSVGTEQQTTPATADHEEAEVFASGEAYVFDGTS